MGRLPERHPGSHADTVAIKDTRYGRGRAAQDRESLLVPSLSCFISMSCNGLDMALFKINILK